MAKKRHSTKRLTKSQEVTPVPLRRSVRQPTAIETNHKEEKILRKDLDEDSLKKNISDLKAQLSEQDFEKFSRQIIKRIEDVDKNLQRKFKLIDNLIKNQTHDN
jgi:hypothetical protein